MSDVIIWVTLAVIGPTVLLRPVWGVALLVVFSLLGSLQALLPFEPDQFIGLLILASGSRVFLNRRRWRRSILDGPTLILLTAGLLAIIGRALAQSQFLLESALQYISLASMTLLALVTYQILSRSQAVSRILQVFAVTAGGVAFVSLMVILTGTTTVLLSGERLVFAAGWGAIMRLGGIYQQPNYLAAIMTLALPIAVAFLVLAATPMRRLFWTSAAGTLLAALLISQARSAILGAAIGLALLGLLLLRRRVLKPSRLAWFVLMLGLAMWLMAKTGYLHELPTRLSWTHQLEIAASDPSQDRLQIWRSALGVALWNPIGFAAEGNLRIGGRLGVDARSGHNVFLSFLVSYGVLGAGAVLWLVWRQLAALGTIALRCEVHHHRVLAAGILAGLVSFWIHNLAHSIVQWIAVWIYFACAAALISLAGMKRSAIDRTQAVT